MGEMGVDAHFTHSNTHHYYNYGSKWEEYTNRTICKCMNEGRKEFWQESIQFWQGDHSACFQTFGTNGLCWQKLHDSDLFIYLNRVNSWMKMISLMLPASDIHIKMTEMKHYKELKSI